MRKGLIALVTSLACWSVPARATIVERVVAVVGERPILLSDVRFRARPFLARIMASAPNAAQQAAAETELYRELLNRMVDDRVEEVAADKAHIGVTSEEIDNAIKNVAANARLSPAELMAEAGRQGLSEQAYRDEIRRQVLEGKLVQLRVRGRVRVGEDDARNAFQRWLRESGNQSLVEVRILALRLSPGENPASRMADAEALRERVTQGEDFCKVVLERSEDVQTKNACGSRGPQPKGALLPMIQQAMEGLDAGGVSRPVVVPNEAVLLVQLASAPKVPTFEEMRESMMERAYAESMERQRKQWLLELRNGMYIDVRM
jgi:peptidyl-prolyl cis-trans isomerase SurA